MAYTKKLGTLSENEKWLLHCSCSDVNWKTHLQDANLKEIDRVFSVETRATALSQLRAERKRRLKKLTLGIREFKKGAKTLFNDLMKYYDEHKNTIIVTNMNMEQLINFRKSPMEESGRILTITIEHEPVPLVIDK